MIEARGPTKELTAAGRSLEAAFLALTSGSAEHRGVAPALPRRR